MQKELDQITGQLAREKLAHLKDLIYSEKPTVLSRKITVELQGYDDEAKEAFRHVIIRKLERIETITGTKSDMPQTSRFKISC